jgi:hypothetical protein
VAGLLNLPSHVSITLVWPVMDASGAFRYSLASG